jgi:ribosomal protein L37AE/L43A
MMCPKCGNQYDIYNAVVNDDTGVWECPDCKVALNDDDSSLIQKISTLL